jgi:hypothetical protein
MRRAHSYATSWLDEHRRTLRMALLVLLVVALAGPWTYTLDGVPPPEWCRPPLILLENGRCVRLVSGLSVLTFGIGALFSLSAQLVTGAMRIGRMRDFLVFLCLVPALPVFSTLLVLWRSGSPRLRAAHTIAWGLAAAGGLWLLTASRPALGRMWGGWLYVGLATSALILELGTSARHRAEE